MYKTKKTFLWYDRVGMPLRKEDKVNVDNWLKKGLIYEDGEEEFEDEETEEEELEEEKTTESKVEEHKKSEQKKEDYDHNTIVQKIKDYAEDILDDGKRNHSNKPDFKQKNEKRKTKIKRKK